MVQFLSKNKSISLKSKTLSFATIFLHIIAFVLSFYFHYAPMYLSVSTSVLLCIIFKPRELDIFIEKEAPEILQNLKKAILIISIKENVLSINPKMSNLLNCTNQPTATIKELSSRLTGSNKAISNWLKTVRTECVYLINGKYYLINTITIPYKGLIITASDIHENVIVQKELERSILDLENLTKTLKLYSLDNEVIVIREERSMVYTHVQKIITKGLNELNADLEQIKNKPPTNYEPILAKSRTLLNEVRAIVTNWRSIKGADY